MVGHTLFVLYNDHIVRESSENGISGVFDEMVLIGFDIGRDCEVVENSWNEVWIRQGGVLCHALGWIEWVAVW